MEATCIGRSFSEALDELDQLIADGDWVKAWDLLRIYVTNDDFVARPELWMRLALVQLTLAVSDDDRAALRTTTHRLQKCEGYEPLKWGDYLCSVVLGWCRTHVDDRKPELADMTLEIANWLFTPHSERLGYLHSVRGRVDMARGKWHQAYKKARDAESRWRKQGRKVHRDRLLNWLYIAVAASRIAEHHDAPDFGNEAKDWVKKLAGHRLASPELKAAARSLVDDPEQWSKVLAEF